MHYLYASNSNSGQAIYQAKNTETSYLIKVKCVGPT